MDMRAVVKDLTAERTRLASELAQVSSALRVLGAVGRRPHASNSAPTRKHRISKAGREAIARAARKRWAAWRKEQRVAK